MFDLISKAKKAETGVAYVCQTMSPFWDAMKGLHDHVWVKAIAGAIVIFVTGVAEHMPALIALMVLVAVDLVLGTTAAIRDGKFLSSRFRGGLLKFLCYLFLFIAFHAIELVIPQAEILNLDTFAIAYLGVTEVLSIMENFSIITNITFPVKIKEVLSYLGKLHRKDGDDPKGSSG